MTENTRKSAASIVNGYGLVLRMSDDDVAPRTHKQLPLEEAQRLVDELRASGHPASLDPSGSDLLAYVVLKD